MADPEDILSGLPDNLRESNRPIIIYQGAPPNQIEALTGNSLGLLFWLALLSTFLAVIVFCFWRVWSPTLDASQYSPVYAKGRPEGIARRIDERALINQKAGGLVEFLDEIRADNIYRRRTKASHPLLNDRDGLDALRRDWDTMCNSRREAIYDRRIGQIEIRIAELRRQRSVERDQTQITRLDADLASLARQAFDENERRRTNSDASLRCVPASLAPVCTSSAEEPWCNPARTRPGEFLDKAL